MYAIYQRRTTIVLHSFITYRYYAQIFDYITVTLQIGRGWKSKYSFKICKIIRHFRK
jgi:hypothetical protein